MNKLAEAFEDAKSPTRRQGVMFAYETLTLTLKRLFEPYIIGILPQMLAGFGDVSSDVREATQDAARAIMQNVSGIASRSSSQRCCPAWTRSSGGPRRARSSCLVPWPTVPPSSSRCRCRRSSRASARC